jgi:hypothetical protein
VNNAYTEFNENTADIIAADIKSQTDRRGLSNVVLVSGLGISSLAPL